MVKKLKTERVMGNWTVFAVCTGLILFMAGLAMANQETYTHRLTQSTSSYQLWTTLPSERVFKGDAVPSVSASEVKVYAAKNEFEPFQVIVKPVSSGNVTVSIGSFGAGITTEIHQVKYVNISTPTDYYGSTGDNPDPLWPISNGASVAVSANQNTSFWFSVYVPKTTASADYSANVQIGGVGIPINLHVFNFAIPDEVHVKSQMNFSHNTIMTKYGVSGTGSEYWSYVDKMKQFFIDHRLTPKSALWSGGLTSSGGDPYIDYNCSGTFTDDDGIWGFEEPADRYLNGTGLMNGTFTESFNDGVGFPSYMAATFQNNDASADQRPSSFCGYTRSSSDWYTANNPNTSYNQEWFSYMTAMQNYLNSLGYLGKSYYYFANEPQDQADYDAVAWYSQELKKVAPNLKLAVSEEPKPEIYNHSTYTGSKIDIWIAHLGLQFDPDTSFDRLKNHNEETWIYFLHGTRLPRFNPITIDHPGIEGKLTGWFLWKYRLRGIAYYMFNGWSANPWTNPLGSGQNGNLFLMYPPSESNSNISYGSNGHRFVPSIRLEMIRDGFEDYEYFYLLNGGSHPQPDQVNPADAQVDKIIGYAVAYNRDSEFMYNLRRLVGEKIGGEISTIPDIAPVSAHSRSDGVPANYYINFQDPAGEPTGTVTYNSNTYMKIGDSLYDPAVGYGWIKAAEVPDSDFYPNWDQWIDPEPKDLLGSSVIDSWGREDVFEFDLPNGIYNVTACAGSRSSTRYQNIVIEGVMFMDDEVTNNSWITRTKQITVKDKKLTMVMGKYEKIGYINYLDIETVSTVTPAEISSPAPSSTLTSTSVTFTWNNSGAEAYWMWVGTAAGANDLYNNDVGTSTSATVSDLPADSQPLYVRLWSKINGSWYYTSDYTYTACEMNANILSPASGSTLSSTSQVFTWNDIGASQYWLWIGTSVGTNDIYNRDMETNASVSVSGLPSDGSLLYARVWSKISGAWQYGTDSIYNACDYSSGSAWIKTPTPGSTLSSTAVTFTWNSAGAPQYWIWVGTSLGSNDIHNGDAGTGNSVVVSGLPDNGGTLYVRLWSKTGSTWSFNTDSIYTACSSNPSVAAIQTPTPGSKLNSTSTTFTWSSTGASQYWLWIGTLLGGNNIYNRGETGTSAVVSGLPSNGETLYVRLWSMVDGVWSYDSDYAYTAVGP